MNPSQELPKENLFGAGPDAPTLDHLTNLPPDLRARLNRRCIAAAMREREAI